MITGTAADDVPPQPSPVEGNILKRKVDDSSREFDRAFLHHRPIQTANADREEVINQYQDYLIVSNRF